MLESLARLHGIADTYLDYRNRPHAISAASQAAVLAVLGVDVADRQAVSDALRHQEANRWASLAPAVVIAREGTPARVALSIPLDEQASAIKWQVRLEDAPDRIAPAQWSSRTAVDSESGCRACSGLASMENLPVLEQGAAGGRSYRRVALDLPPLPPGYHDAYFMLDTGASSASDVIVAPLHCHGAMSDGVIDSTDPLEEQAEGRAALRRVWGIAVQLYSLRSADNWGIGDLRDLRELVSMAAPLGCSLIGLNPLHALMPADALRISPYSPSSRQFLNVMYIAVPDVPDFLQCEAAQRRVRSREFQSAIHACRAADKVDYAKVASLKFEILRLLHESFRKQHLLRDSERAGLFRQFVNSRGDALRLHAIHDALDSYWRAQGPQYQGWPAWPLEYRDPSSGQVQRFAAEHSLEVEYFMYLQWLVAEQLQAAQDVAFELGMSIGLYGDLAVGADRAGSEVWSNRRLYVHNAAVGAPPDELALKGQNWGVPPQDPAELLNQRFRPFIQLLRSNMRSVAALRLDHVMSLQRLWWVPAGRPSSEGAYVHYGLDALMAILTLESQRTQCAVIGEDLGTVPAEVGAAMAEHGIYHYKVLLFEQTAHGEFRQPSQYETNALATVTTHDLPTLRGWWEGCDLQLRERLDLYPSAQLKIHAQEVRAGERRALMRALVAAGLWHWYEEQPLPPYSAALARAVHAFLGMTSSRIALIQLEDLIGMSDPVNVPGTSTEHPNWQRKMALDTSAILARADVQDILKAMRIARSGEHPNDPRFHEPRESNWSSER